MDIIHLSTDIQYMYSNEIYTALLWNDNVEQYIERQSFFSVYN